MTRPWYGISSIIKKADGTLLDAGSYFQSKKWKEIRRSAIARAQNKCAKCGKYGREGYHALSLEIHHKTYERFGDELDEDIEALCRSCHRQADAERRERTGGGPEGYFTLQ